MSEVVVLCSDKDYAGALMENLSEDKGLGVRISIYTDPLRYNPQEVEDVFFVADYDEFNLWEELVDPERTLFLTGSTRKCPYEMSVSKYTSVDEIASGLLEVMSKSDDLRLTISKESPAGKKDETVVIGFFSPVRRCSQTTFGMTIGNVISESKKVLFLSFESFSPFWSMTGVSPQKSIEDLLMTAKESPEKFDLVFNSTVYHGDCIDMIPPIRSLHQILDVRASDWINLINVIRDRCSYDVIILDLSESMHGLLDLLGMCDRIYTITKDDPYATAKLNEYETLLRSCERDEITNKTIRQRIPYIEEIPNGFHYKPFSEFARYVKETIMGDGLYARICLD